MATARIEVPFWPTSTDNLRWSADNLIAVGGGDSIAILVPRLNTKGPNNLSWDSIVHRVNLFTVGELPFVDPHSSVNWSIGEELSLRHVTSLDWSSPGLARFGTCALAILHSNYVLTLWECVGQPHIKDKWRRCLMINRVIKAYYGNSMTSDPETKRVRQRIRAFAWLPAVRKKSVSTTPGLSSHLAQSEHYLAVSTDGGDILVLKVWSPHDALAPENVEWGCTVVHCLRLSSTNGRSAAEISMNSGVSPVSSATALAFSAWTDRGDSRLAYIAKDRLYVCNVHYDESADLSSRFVITEPQQYDSTSTSDLSGPLHFAPKSNSVLLSGPDKIINIDTAFFSGDPRSHHLDGRWDAISGLAFVTNANGDGDASPDVHIVSHLSTASSGTSKLPVTLGKVAKPQEPNWQNAIQENKANFGAAYDLGSNVQERTWGIASSPLGDFVATCVSLLPSDTPAHVIQSEQRSIVSITMEYNNEEVPIPANGGRALPEDISAETLLYDLRQHASRNGKVDGSKENAETIRQLAMTCLRVSESELNSIGTTRPSWAHDDTYEDEIGFSRFGEYLNEMRARIFYERHMFAQRIDRLVDVALQHQPQLQLSKESYSRLADVVLTLPQLFKEASPLSRKIETAFAAVKAKIDSYGSSVDPAMTEPMRFVESCNICRQDVNFESLRWSRCAGGHQFSRCTLTFLSIMEPGISKSCRICNALYIDEDALPVFHGKPSVENEDQTMVDADSTGDVGKEQQAEIVEPRMSLARLIFAACDKCILCGGKFVI
ncbi:hypothetical protein Q7P37_006608 [Cladosporium fusiforme]